MVVMVWQMDLQLHVESVPIATKILSSNPVHGEVYSIQHYLIKFVSDLLHITYFLRVLRFPPRIKLKVALNTIKQPTNSITYLYSTKIHIFSREIKYQSIIRNI